MIVSVKVTYGKDEAEDVSEDGDKSDDMNEDESDSEVGAEDEPDGGVEIDGVNESENDREDEAEDEAKDYNIEDEGDDENDSGEDYATIEQKKNIQGFIHNVSLMDLDKRFKFIKRQSREFLASDVESRNLLDVC